MRLKTIIFLASLTLMFDATATGIISAETTLTYQMPPDEIAALIDAPRTPYASISPDNQWLLLIGIPNYPSIEEVAQPEERLAGLRINPRTNGSSRNYYRNSLTLLKISDQSQQKITGLPENPKLQTFKWSPDSRYVAFTRTSSEAVELWLAEVATSTARRLSTLRLNDAAYGDAFYWLSDSRTLVCRALPEKRQEKPQAPQVPVGPIVQENTGKKAPARTYADLLKNPHDEDLFEYYLTAQVATVDVEGTVNRLGDPALIITAEPSPDGNYFLVETIHRPFSYLVPAYRFPKTIEIWDRSGRVVRQIDDLPLAEEIPIGRGAARRGARRVEWRADVPATVVWAEAQDGGDPKTEVKIRDHLYALKAPFDGDPVLLAALGLRYGGVDWGTGEVALVYDWWWSTRQSRMWRIQPDHPEKVPHLIYDRSFEDRYTDPGDPMKAYTPSGTRTLILLDDGKTIFMAGDGHSPEGKRPFMDQFDLESGKSTRLWRSEAPFYEYGIRLIDPEERLLLTGREAVEQPRNYFVRDLDDSTLTQLTDFPHPTPQLKDVRKELIQYQRADSVNLSATLYLPPGYTPEQGPLPVLVWAYPEEFKSADAAGQITDSPYQFDRVGWWTPLLWLVHGYAVLDDPSLPIIGEGDAEPNDTYVEQLVAGAQAAVDEIVRRGVADADRIAIGGHSYGAFMTANLLAHSDLFRAGIARTGAYNRTLTPFGFQAEERTLWEARDTYIKMSPFMYADHINEPLLLIHGDADNNAGTFPMQSERMYEALKGLGKTARLVMLPHESHSYRARESIMHMAWEMTRWLDTYVKNAPPRHK